MIDGFRIDVTADELKELLDARIERHRRIAADCESRRARLETVTTPDPDDEDEQLAAAWPAYVERLARRAERHRDRATSLEFVRDHLAPFEIYRLDESDLRQLRIWPVGDWTVLAARGVRP